MYDLVNFQLLPKSNVVFNFFLPGGCSCVLGISSMVAFAARYVGVAAFTVWKDTFDHGWIMPFLTAGRYY